jgi:hypothetical protein
MNKIILTAAAVVLAINLSSAQNTYPWPAAGNAGIGTSAPGTLLQVAGDANTSGAPDNAQLYITGATSPGKRLSLGYNVSSNYGEIQSQAFSGAYTALNLNPNGGNVGIGTTTPAAKIEVASGTADPFYFNGTYNKIKSALGFTYVESFHSTSFIIDATGSYSDRFFNIAARASYIGGGSPVELFRVQENGNVGIGTASPDQKLTVNGTIHARQVNVDVNIPVPDYVFGKNYKLKSLPEVSRYISLNKHLPGMPAAKDLEQTGINVTEMNMQLLRKVEELTLYLIEKDSTDKQKDARLARQQTALERQQKEIDLLKKQVKSLIKI